MTNTKPQPVFTNIGSLITSRDGDSDRCAGYLMWNEPVPGRELHPLKSSAFHGALFHQLPNLGLLWKGNDSTAASE